MRLILEEVLREVRPGRVVKLDLGHIDPTQRRCADFGAAVDLLRHLLGARWAASGDYWLDCFPLSSEALERTSMRLGAKVPRDTCRRYRRLLIATGVILRMGQYRQCFDRHAPNAQFIVRTYTTKIVGLCCSSKKNSPSAAAGKSSAIPTAETVPWWQHKLFGDYEGLPPPEFRRQERKRKRHLDRTNEESWLRAVAHAS